MPDKLYDYYFHFNIYTKKWNAVKRTQANQYLNGTLQKTDVLEHENMNKLISKLPK